MTIRQLSLRPVRRLAGLPLFVSLLLLSTVRVHGAEIVEIEVHASPSVLGPWQHSASVSTVEAETLRTLRPAHPFEVLSRVPGTWVSRGSGQEHLTAIRSGVLTGPGACGAFLLLENGIPIRPQGFCNVNGLFELNLEQASAVEVIRGPGSAVLGGNALHGAINVLQRPLDGDRLSVDLGPHDFRRAAASFGGESGAHQWQAKFLDSHTNGYRHDTGYDLQKVVLGHDHNGARWSLSSRLAGNLLNQETGGQVRGKDAYKRASLRRSNPNPEAFRDVKSLRLSLRAQRALGQQGGELSITPWARYSSMDFLQHFLPGQPLEENGHRSAGVRVFVSVPATTDVTLTGGTEVEGARTWLRERQDLPTVGSPFLMATRPAGQHYDYETDSVMAALFGHASVALNERFLLEISSRAEVVRYDYDNRISDGNARDDGSACGFGGCLYTRPADRDDQFENIGARISLTAALGDEHELFAALANGFRPPQITELYRLQSGQRVADLDSEALYSLEWGVKGERETIDYRAVVYLQRKRNFIFRDSNGFNVSDGRTRSAGLEVDASWRLAPRHELAIAASYARHRYDFDRAAAAGEMIEKGNDVDTAPRTSGTLHWRWQLSERWQSELEWLHLGGYYLNAANNARYPGHDLFNARISWRPGERWRFHLKVDNLLATDIADRADFAFGSFRYFPGPPRQLMLGVDFLPGAGR